MTDQMKCNICKNSWPLRKKVTEYKGTIRCPKCHSSKTQLIKQIKEKVKNEPSPQSLEHARNLIEKNGLTETDVKAAVEALEKETKEIKEETVQDNNIDIEEKTDSVNSEAIEFVDEAGGLDLSQLDQIQQVSQQPEDKPQTQIQMGEYEKQATGNLIVMIIRPILERAYPDKPLTKIEEQNIVEATNVCFMIYAPSAIKYTPVVGLTYALCMPFAVRYIDDHRKKKKEKEVINDGGTDTDIIE